MIQEVWLPLSSSDDSPDDLYCELYREVSGYLVHHVDEGDFASVVADRLLSQDAFISTSSGDFSGEESAARFLSAVWGVLDDSFETDVARTYCGLLNSFIDRHNLRYSVDEFGRLYPSLEGLFVGALGDLRSTARLDSHLESLMVDLEQSLFDLSTGESDGRIRTCIQKQMNLLEALGQTHPKSKGSTLGKICDELDSWPHAKVRDAMKNLYGFASDYPGIRHGGTPGNALRRMDMRDLISLSICILGFTPYLSSNFDAAVAYRGHSGD
ncbi:hypothetical protein ACWFRB_01525 [Rhodococcus sp. NPDC055112]